MKCLVTSFGSAGDFLPTLALGGALKRRGHDVRFVANPFYQSRAQSAGLELTPAGEHCDLYALFEENPAYGDPANAKLLFTDLVVPNSVATYRVIVDLLRSEAFDVVIGNDASFAAIWAAQEHRVPSVFVHASPLIWMSWNAPAVLGDSALFSWLSRPASAIAHTALHLVLTRWLRVLAAQLGTHLPDVSFRGTEGMTALLLALWSPLLRAPAASDPPNGTICGFTHSSAFGGVRHDLAAEVDAFLRAGPPPVVVGFGSAFALIAGPVLSNIAEACSERKLRCLVIGHPRGMTFPANTLAVPYAPYDEVFPRAAAVVVHCGSGTTGEALRCGRPIIGVPFAYDQFGLSAAVERLGAGVRVRSGKRSSADFADTLDRVFSNDRLRRRAAETGPQFATERDGAESGADAVERLVRQRT